MEVGPGTPVEFGWVGHYRNCETAGPDPPTPRFGSTFFARFCTFGRFRARHTLGAYETPIDKMLSLPPQRATLEPMPDQGAEPRPDGL